MRPCALQVILDLRRSVLSRFGVDVADKFASSYVLCQGGLTVTLLKKS